MPRHDRANGHYHSSRAGGGKISRRSRGKTNRYAAKQLQRSRAVHTIESDELPVVENGRKDSNTRKDKPQPQTPKQPGRGGRGGKGGKPIKPKGGSK